MRNLFSSALLIFSLLAFCTNQGHAQSGADEVTPTEISAGQGSCSALITVTGAESKPIYDAKVTTRVHYGLMGLKKVDLETYTSAKGQVKIVGLPEVPKKPIFIYVSKGDKLETLEFKPDVHCHEMFNVQLK